MEMQSKSHKKKPGPVTVFAKQKDLANRIAAVEALGKSPVRGVTHLTAVRSCLHISSVLAVAIDGQRTLEWMCSETFWSRYIPIIPGSGFSPARLPSRFLLRVYYMFVRYMEGIQREMAQQQHGKPACGTDYSEADGQPSLLEFATYKPYAFRADEYGPIGGRFHLHALIGNVSTVTMFCGERLGKWEWGINCCGLHRWPCGYARVFAYDPALAPAST